MPKRTVNKAPTKTNIEELRLLGSRVVTQRLVTSSLGSSTSELTWRGVRLAQRIWQLEPHPGQARGSPSCTPVTGCSATAAALHRAPGRPSTRAAPAEIPAPSWLSCCLPLNLTYTLLVSPKFLNESILKF